jgi:AcrR family transcriptional regulator
MPEPPSDSNGQRRLPKQSRSVETFESILEAASRQFAERGYDQCTTHQIADQAGISVGALYRYFADKQAILMELYRREITDMRQRLLDQFDVADVVGRDVREIVRRTLGLAFRIYGDKPGLRRVLGEQTRKIDAMAEMRRQQEEELHAAVRRILEGARGVSLSDPEVGAYLIRLFVECLVDDYLHHPKAAPRFDQERLLDGATEFILRYALGTLDDG